MAFNYNDIRSQGGAAMVEFAITFLIYLLLIFAIIEFALVIFNATRLAEGTRVGARYAIVNDPACDILNRGSGPACTNAVEGHSRGYCDGMVGVVIDSCEIPATSPECMMVEEMDRLMMRYSGDAAAYENRSILAGEGQVYICYELSGVGDPDGPYDVYNVTIAPDNIQHYILFLGMIGVDSTINLPSFATTRTAEDLYSN